MRRFATVLPALTAAALLAPSAASARVVLVATGDGAATLTDVATNQVVARIPVGGRSRAVAAAPDGARGYVPARPPRTGGGVCGGGGRGRPAWPARPACRWGPPRCAGRRARWP